jgi:hypothetical protein
VFRPDDSQQIVFDEIQFRNFIDKAFQGFAVNLLAYGMTGSGVRQDIERRSAGIATSILTVNCFVFVVTENPHSVRFSQRAKRRHHGQITIIYILQDSLQVIFLLSRSR